MKGLFTPDAARIRRSQWFSTQNAVFLVLLIFGAAWFSQVRSRLTSSNSIGDVLSYEPLATSRGRIAKVSMLYGNPHAPSYALYERALKSHKRHAEKWNYPFHVLRHDLSTGFWNKPTYLLYLLIQEMSKEPTERVEWLMWVDADSIVLNPSIPASIFLPPADLSHLHFVGTRDFNGLNTGIFYLRVHPWSIAMLTETLGMPLFHREVDLGRSADQEAMARIFNKTRGGPDNKGYKNNILYVPRQWINAYEFTFGFEGNKGDLLVHFPGLEQERWQHMADWLDLIDSRPQEYDIPLDKTEYWDRTHQYWKDLRNATATLKSAEAQHKVAPNIGLSESAKKLRIAMTETGDEMDKIKELAVDVYQRTQQDKANKGKGH